MRNFDAIVIGLAAMGSALAYQLASHGVKVLGLEKLPLHEFTRPAFHHTFFIPDIKIS